MKILLNGATGGTNFGDYLFAHIFHKTVADHIGEDNVFWYDSRYCLSDFYKRHLKCNARKHKLSDIDMLICISGGYFCGDDKRLKDYVIRYLRYFRLCIRCMARKIPVAIIGVDVAKPKSKIMDCIQKYILCHADLVIVRNDESYAQLKRYGVKNPIRTVDTAHVIERSVFADCEVQENIAEIEGEKLFFHIQPSALDAAKKIVPTINKFLADHPEYTVVVGTDQYSSDDSYLDRIANMFTTKCVVVNHYDNPIALCKTLDMMDLVVTPKLHVGIVSATLGKSVVSFSVHSEKITRFYRQIGEEERSMPMHNFLEDKALRILNKYHNISIGLDNDIIKAAISNLEYLKEFIDKHSDK